MSDIQREDVVIAFFVAGKAVGQPRATPVNVDGFVRVIEAPGKHPIHHWKAALRADALRAMRGKPPVNHAVRLDMRFVLPRPQKYLTKKFVGQFIPHVSKPDCDNALKACQDAFNGIVWTDDRLISTVSIQKRYVMLGERPGAHVIVARDVIESVPDDVKAQWEEIPW